MKTATTWGGGMGIGMTAAIFAVVLILGFGGSSMRGLNGQPLLASNEAGDLSEMSPEAGGDMATAESCGTYYEWIGSKLDQGALKKTGKKFRILPPNSMMTQDHNPARINVHTDENGIVEDVKCG